MLVQGNIAQGQKWDRALVMRIFDRYLSLTREGVAQRRQRAGRGGLAGDRQPVPAADRCRGAGGDRRGGRRPARPGRRGALRPVRPAAQQPVRRLAGGRLLPGNAGIYDKWHLVPFGEYQPSWFPAPFQVVPGGGFQPGPGPKTLHIPGLPPVGPLICYEAIFSGQVVDAADRPAWLVNITNDAWFGNSTGPRQHLAAARLRAVEEGLPLMRAANTGISAAFDPRGHELARLGMNRAGELVVDLPAALPPTLFARLGLCIPALIGIVGLGFGLSVRGGVAFGTMRRKN